LVLVKDVTTIVTRALGGPELSRRNVSDEQLVDLRVRPSGVVWNEEEGDDDADDRPAGKPEGQKLASEEGFLIRTDQKHEPFTPKALPVSM
jgi:hypothetical protein